MKGSFSYPSTLPSWSDGLKGLVVKRGGEVNFNEPLMVHTSFQIGGPAEALVSVKDEASFFALLQFAQEHNIKITILGKGTNVLISDQGLSGILIKLTGELQAIEVDGEIIRAGAGALLDRVAEVAEENDLIGAEFLAGIPGTVGGALMSNAGAFGHTIGEVIKEVIVASLSNVAGPRTEERGPVFALSELHKEYRSPVIPPGLVALWVVFQLKKGKSERRVDEIRKERFSKHPSEPSAGSFFKNPKGAPAGKLIETCGLKGLQVGGAKVSEKHANFIVNQGGAKFGDVYELSQIVKSTVEEMTGVELEEEVKILP